MSKPSGLWQRKRDQFWMTTINGKQVKLSKDKSEARTMLHRRLADDRPAQSSGVTCRRLLDTYLVKTAAEKSEKRVKVQTSYFKKFCEAHGHRRAESLKPFEVNDWVDGLKVSDSTKALALSMLKAGFNWGQREGYITHNPLKAVRKRKMARRERMLTPAEVEAVLKACKPHWRDYFTVLHLTGMRPLSEAGSLTAAHLDRERKRAVLMKHKTAKKTGKPRVVYFPPAAWEIIERYAEKRPMGPIFRNGVGKVLCSRCVNDYLADACKRAGVTPFESYMFRHYRLSSALASGVPIEVLSELSGNSPAILRQNYQHLGADVMAGVLAKAAEKAAE